MWLFPDSIVNTSLTFSIRLLVNLDYNVPNKNAIFCIENIRNSKCRHWSFMQCDVLALYFI